MIGKRVTDQEIAYKHVYPIVAVLALFLNLLNGAIQRIFASEVMYSWMVGQKAPIPKWDFF
jgi:hypothetical protein